MKITEPPGPKGRPIGNCGWLKRTIFSFRTFMFIFILGPLTLCGADYIKSCGDLSCLIFHRAIFALERTHCIVNFETRRNITLNAISGSEQRDRNHMVLAKREYLGAWKKMGQAMEKLQKEQRALIQFWAVCIIDHGKHIRWIERSGSIEGDSEKSQYGILAAFSVL
jgi:hypothetical protein